MRGGSGAAGLPTRRAILYGTLAVGVLDILEAFVFFGALRGVPPIAILQNIASGSSVARPTRARGVPRPWGSGSTS